MSKRLGGRGLRLARDHRVAVVRCDECPWTGQYAGPRESHAYEAAKRHAERLGHWVHVTVTRDVAYAPAAATPTHAPLDAP